jgi:serine/threonine-protein kinase SRPK3
VGTVEWEGQPFSVKIADLGNATRSDAHHVYDIQTLEYRAPEVVLGRSWDDKVDVWSMGCVFFELATGDVLFNPCEAGPCPSFSKEEDLLAQMQELTEYDLQPDDLEGGAYASRFFAPNGRMRRIKSLNYWREFASSYLRHI